MGNSNWSRFNKARASRSDRGVLTKPEREFSESLERRRWAGEVLWYEEHPLSLRLGHSLRYEPDFVALISTEDGTHLEVYEVKPSAGWRLDSESRTKFVAAVERFPFLTFVCATQRRKKDGGGFDEVVYPPRRAV